MCKPNYNDNATTHFLCTGIFLFYCPLMQTSFWFCHVVAVFWTIQFPITARRFENKGYFKFVHLGMVAAVLVLPWITLGIILGTQGYVISRFPTILCFPRNVNVTFYAFILPLSIILATGMSLIVIIFWVLIGLVQIHNESKVCTTHSTLNYKYHKTQYSCVLVAILTVLTCP